MRTTPIAALLLAGSLTAGALLTSTPAVSASRVDGNRALFCTPARVIADQVARPALSSTAQQDAVLARTLERTAKHAPRKVRRAMRDLAQVYTSIGKATSDADHASAAYGAAVEYQTAQRVFADYYSTHCSTAPVSAPNLPGVGAANQAACLADSRTIQMAETEYSTLNGDFGTMDQLVGTGLLRARSAYHPDITVGSPAGGYTIVGNQGCGNVPVAG